MANVFGPLAQAFSCLKYLKVKGWQRVPKGPRFEKGTYWSKVGKGYIKVQGWQSIPKVQSWQRVLKEPRFEKGT